MYLLDTNIISELRKAKSKNIDKNVAKWAHCVSATSLFLSVITILELETGILSVERRDSSQGAVLRTWMDTHVLPVFSERILPLDIAVAQRCAHLHGSRSKIRSGRYHRCDSLGSWHDCCYAKHKRL